jgi:hypothetical protein
VVIRIKKMWKLRKSALEAPQVFRSFGTIRELPMDLSLVEVEVVAAPSITSSEELAEVGYFDFPGYNSCV